MKSTPAQIRQKLRNLRIEIETAAKLANHHREHVALLNNLQVRLNEDFKIWAAMLPGYKANEK